MSGRSMTQADWLKLACADLKRVLKAAAKEDDHWSADLALISAREMSRLNKVYRGRDYPTDVLSFPSPGLFRAEGHLGEIIICLPTLKAQAKEHAHQPEIELKILLVHSVLHLLGFDHEKGGKAEKEMAAQELKLLRRAFPRLKAIPGLIARAGKGKKP
ncbi:MAG: rRNA maturation RNase YbeY [Bdellovibrionota bacterium]